MRFFSPAKINLFLRVLGRRLNGYHDLETLFERISLGDEIFLTPTRSEISFHTDAENIPAGPSNLAWRAATLLRDRYHVQKGVAIRLKKRIPVSAGLGGGSSNAATVLLGLNRLWKLNLPQKKLLALAAELGSDVPFFILNTPFAVGTGRGEILKKINRPKLKIWHCLVKPGFGISTKEAYQGLPPSFLTPQNGNVKMLLHSIQKGDSGRLTELLINSLEVSVNKRVKTILKIKSELIRQGALASLMSGSGSAVFGIFSSRQKADLAARFLKKKNKSWQVFVVSTY